MLLVVWQEGHLACKKTEWWGAGIVIQIGFTFLVPAHPCSRGQRAAKRVCHNLREMWAVYVQLYLHSCHYTMTHPHCGSLVVLETVVLVWRLKFCSLSLAT